MRLRPPQLLQLDSNIFRDETRLGSLLEVDSAILSCLRKSDSLRKDCIDAAGMVPSNLEFEKQSKIQFLLFCKATKKVHGCCMLLLRNGGRRIAAGLGEL